MHKHEQMHHTLKSSYMIHLFMHTQISRVEHTHLYYWLRSRDAVTVHLAKGIIQYSYTGEPGLSSQVLSPQSNPGASPRWWIGEWPLVKGWPAALAGRGPWWALPCSLHDFFQDVTWLFVLDFAFVWPWHTFLVDSVRTHRTVYTCFGTVWPFWRWCALKLRYHSLIQYSYIFAQSPQL